MLYKVLDVDGTPINGGMGKWWLPENGQPGKWMPPIKGKIIPCQNGYHLCRKADLVYWLGPIIWEAEGKGQAVTDMDKVVFRSARLLQRLESWNERTARLFACDCAEHVLPIFEAKFPDDKRPRQAIEAARRFTNGEATIEELDAVVGAAGDAAWDAAWAARDAARAAARAARAAPWDASWAARDAAWVAWAARDAARDARDAARDAARAAARAAGDAARDAARAARATERKWQTEKLFQYLEAR